MMATVETQIVRVCWQSTVILMMSVNTQTVSSQWLIPAAPALIVVHCSLTQADVLHTCSKVPWGWPYCGLREGGGRRKRVSLSLMWFFWATFSWSTVLAPPQPYTLFLKLFVQIETILIVSDQRYWQIETILTLNLIKSIVTCPSCDQYLHSLLCYKYTPWYFFFPRVELRRTTHTTTTAPVSNPNTSRNMTTMNQAVW